MTRFEIALNLLFGGLPLYENDPGFGYRMYRLKNEDQARVFRLPRQKAKAVNNEPPPTRGEFVALATDPKTNKLIIAYCVFPPTGESMRLAALAYDPRELAKGQRQIVNFLNKGLIPVADQEYATAGE